MYRTQLQDIRIYFFYFIATTFLIQQIIDQSLFWHCFQGHKVRVLETYFTRSSDFAL